MKKYYLAYGSNLNIQQMKYRCPDANPIGYSYIFDYELLFKGSKTGSYLTIESKKGGRVPVGIWEISEKDEKSLDRYEGFPNFYYKAEMEVPAKIFKTGKMKMLTGMVYIMHENRKLGVPSRLYWDICERGYSDFDLDMQFLAKAYEKSVKESRV